MLSSNATPFTMGPASCSALRTVRSVSARPLIDPMPSSWTWKMP